MLDKIKQAIRMWEAGNTHGEILEVSGLAREQELASTEIAKKYHLTAEHIFARLPCLSDGMKWEEVERALIA